MEYNFRNWLSLRENWNVFDRPSSQEKDVNPYSNDDADIGGEPEDDEPTSNMNFNLQTIGSDEINELSGRAVNMFRDYINAADNKAQAINNLRQMIKNAIGIHTESLFGQPDVQQISDTQLWDMIEELTQSLHIHYNGNKDYIEQHFANLLNGAFGGAGRIFKNKARKPQPPTSQKGLFDQ